MLGFAILCCAVPHAAPTEDFDAAGEVVSLGRIFATSVAPPEPTINRVAWFRTYSRSLFHPLQRPDAMVPEMHAWRTNDPVCDPRSSVSILIGEPIPTSDKFEQRNRSVK
jgi:hypothetical protein